MWMSSSSLGLGITGSPYWSPSVDWVCLRGRDSWTPSARHPHLKNNAIFIWVSWNHIRVYCVLCNFKKKTLLRMDFNRVWQHWHDFDKPRLALGISLGFESSSGCMVLLRIVTVCLSVSCSEKGEKKLIFFAAWKCRAPLSQTGWLNSNHSPRSH